MHQQQLLPEPAGLVHRDRAVSTGLSLHTVERPGEGTPVLLLHGIWGSWRAWLPVIAQEADPFRGRPLVLIDLRGHGGSDHPADGYGLSDYGSDLAAFIQQLDAPRVTLVGHSLGALTSLVAATIMPERIESLVLEDPPLPFPTGPDDLDPFWVGFAEAVFGLSKLKHQPHQVIVEQLMVRNAQLTPYEAEESARSLASTADGVFASILTGEFQGTNALPLTVRIDAPALVVQAAIADDQALKDAGVALLRHALPRMRVVSIPGTGHSIHRAAPEAFRQLIDAFLDGNAA